MASKKSKKSKPRSKPKPKSPPKSPETTWDAWSLTSRVEWLHDALQGARGDVEKLERQVVALEAERAAREKREREICSRVNPFDSFSHAAGTYLVRYPSGQYHSAQRLRAMLARSGDTMATVEVVGTGATATDEKEKVTRDDLAAWRRTVLSPEGQQSMEVRFLDASGNLLGRGTVKVDHTKLPDDGSVVVEEV